MLNATTCLSQLYVAIILVLNVFWNFRIVLAIDKELIDNYMAKLEAKKHLRLKLDPDCLRWTPLISNYNISEEEKKAEKEVVVCSVVFDYIMYKLTSYCK